jgi:hypothetical protein
LVRHTSRGTAWRLEEMVTWELRLDEDRGIGVKQGCAASSLRSAGQAAAGRL